MHELDHMIGVAEGLLAGELAAAESGTPDLRRLRDLSGLLKDLSGLSRDLGGAAPREIRVSFEGAAEDASR